MTIGFDASRAFTPDKTGTENYSCQLLKALTKIDKKNDYIVYLRPGTQGDALRGWPDNFQFSVINFQFLWTQVGLALETFRDVLHPSKMDTLFVPAHTLPLIRKPGLKTVVTVHDLGSQYLPQTHQLKQRLYLGFMQKYQLKGASKIIAVSEATKTDLIKRLKIKPEKIKVVYEGFDREMFKPVAGDLLVNSLRRYNLQPKTYFLFVGTVQPRKNLERLILAFNKFVTFNCSHNCQDLRLMNNDLRVKNHKSSIINHQLFKLVIAGSKGWLSDDIYKLPKKLGIEEKVNFLGYVPDKDLPALYSGASAFLFPSLFEGFGLPILEAQACGCPVLTSNVSSMPEIAGKGAVLVDPFDINDIVEGMKKVQTSPASLREATPKAGEAGRANIKDQIVKRGFENIKRFSWEKCAAQTLSVFENLKFKI